MPPLLFNLGVHDSLCEGLIKHCPADTGELEMRCFPDGETYVRILSDCTGRSAIVACSLVDPDAKILSLLFVADTLREMGAASVGLVAPYLAYMRQDHRFQPGEAVTARYFARIVSAHFDWLAAVDPHLHRFASLDEVYSVPTRVAQAAPDIARWLRTNVDRPVLIGPDRESEQWVAAVAQKTGAPYLVLVKVREGDKEVRISIPQVEAYVSRTPVLVDDIVSTGHTMIETLRHLLRAGMRPAVCIGVHGLFCGDAYHALGSAGAGRVVTCNTIGHASNTIDISRCLAKAVMNSVEMVERARNSRPSTLSF